MAERSGQMAGEGEEIAGGASAGAGGLEDLTFEELMSALEDLTQRMSSGDIGIEEATDLYERAERLHSMAAARLANVQARIDKLAGGGTG